MPIKSSKANKSNGFSDHHTLTSKRGSDSSNLGSKLRSGGERSPLGLKKSNSEHSSNSGAFSPEPGKLGRAPISESQKNKIREYEAELRVRAAEEGRQDPATARAMKRVARRLYRKLEQMHLLDEDIAEAEAAGPSSNTGGRSHARAAALAHREKQAAFDSIFGDPSNGPNLRRVRMYRAEEMYMLMEMADEESDSQSNNSDKSGQSEDKTKKQLTVDTKQFQEVTDDDF